MIYGKKCLRTDLCGDALIPILLLQKLVGDEDSQLADSVGVDLPELQPPVELRHDGLDQLQVGDGGLPPGQIEDPAEDLSHALLQGVVEPPAGDDERHEDPGESPEVSGVLSEPSEMAQVDLDELLGAEEEAGSCSKRDGDRRGGRRANLPWLSVPGMKLSNKLSRMEMT